ncbi:hypothetical protein WJX73_006826 [Symbiochloris irregularis]|uniref:Uncharacterized protein n=1 Tax=Symbiochloris irregularis TaxID=706552 RepID=A0AAW1PR50_9CHLO
MFLTSLTRLQIGGEQAALNNFGSRNDSGTPQPLCDVNYLEVETQAEGQQSSVCPLRPLQGRLCTHCCRQYARSNGFSISDFQERTLNVFENPGSIYNVLSHHSATVNVQLAQAGDPSDKQEISAAAATPQLAFSFSNTTFLLQISAAGNLSVTIDDTKINLGQPWQSTRTGVNLTFNPSTLDGGQELTLDTGLLQFSAAAVRAPENKIAGLNRGRLRLKIKVLQPPGSLTGILGQSLHARPESRLKLPKEGEAQLRIDAKHFTVKGLFESMPLKQAASRRRRLVERQDLKLPRYPLTASLQWVVP